MINSCCGGYDSFRNLSGPNKRFVEAPGKMTQRNTVPYGENSNVLEPLPPLLIKLSRIGKLTDFVVSIHKNPDQFSEMNEGDRQFVLSLKSQRNTYDELVDFLLDPTINRSKKKYTMHTLVGFN